MKKLILTSILALLVAAGASAIPQDYPDEYLGLPGDNLNLYAVMKLFQESETLEGFERNLNNENSRINNLDLNGDNLIDYITVQDYTDGDVHTIVLRVALNRNEFQDVAVFTVQKFRDGSVQIQLVGDEDLYGKNYIIEPIYDETPNPGYTGGASRRVTVNVVRTTPYEVAVWPVVRYIYMPDYVVWRSSWYWGYYPSYWNPWRPYYWHYYYGYHYNWYHHYYNHYRHWDHYRYARYNDYYYRSVRAHSPYVSQRIKEGQYRNTYSRPEQRREGEALYTKSYPNQARRTADNTPAVQERRSVPQNSGNRSSEGSGTVRRQATTDSQRPTTRSASDANTGSARRSAPAASERPVNRSSSEKSTGTLRRAPVTGGEKPASRSSSEQNTGTVRRSSSTVNDKPATRSSSEQNTGTLRRAPATVGEKPAARSSSEQNAPAVRRETSSASERSASRPSQSARSQSSAGSRQPAASARSSESRSTRESKPAQTSRRSEEKKESSSSSSRRK